MSMCVAKATRPLRRSPRATLSSGGAKLKNFVCNVLVCKLKKKTAGFKTQPSLGLATFQSFYRF